MAREKKPEEVKPGAPEYMNTYGDLVTLLLCFFVLLFAFSTVDAKKFEAMAGSFTNSPVAGQGGGKDTIKDLYGSGLMQMPSMATTKKATEVDKMTKEQVESKEETKTMASEFQTYFAENNIAEQVQVDQRDEGIVLTFLDGVLFDPGKAILKKNSLGTLNTVATKLLAYPDNDIQIEGHTDADPINTPQFPSNWYLSSARAIAVLSYFQDEKNFAPNRIQALGKGEYSPLVKNDTPANKAKNRRVEILVKTKYFSKTNTPPAN